MTTRIRTLFAVAATLFAAASTVPAARAQNVHARVQIPFAFDYGSRHFEPGLYRIDNLSASVLELSGRRAAAMVIYRSDVNMQPAESSYILFRKYGDRYFLQEVWSAASAQHLSILESNSETRAIRERSMTDSGTSVQVAFLRTPAR
jgi:hypothetical protein